MLSEDKWRHVGFCEGFLHQCESDQALSAQAVAQGPQGLWLLSGGVAQAHRQVQYVSHHVNKEVHGHPLLLICDCILDQEQLNFPSARMQSPALCHFRQSQPHLTAANKKKCVRETSAPARR